LINICKISRSSPGIFLIFVKTVFMNYLDIILAIPLLWAVYRGFTKGLVIEVASLAALILGIWGAIRFSWFTADWLTRQWEWSSPSLPVVSFAITFLAIVMAVHLVARLVDKLVRAVALGPFNRILGVVFGVAKMGFILSIVLVIVNAIDRSARFIPEKDREESVLYGPVSSFAPALFPYLNFEEIRDRVRPEEHREEMRV